MGLMRRWRVVSCVVLAAAAGAGCETKAASADAEGTPHPLCPDCSSAGGESTDFDGERVECCDATRSAIGFDDARAAALGAERAMAWIEAGYEGPFEWSRSWGSSLASGYSSETSLSLRASIESLDYVDQERSAEPSNPYLCPNVDCNDHLVFGVHVELSTADGALDGSGDIQVWSAPPSPTWVADPVGVAGGGTLPITRFSGTLALGNGTEAPRAGGVAAGILFSEHGVHGSVTPWIRTIAASEGFRLYEGPLVGRWPVPSCAGVGSLPLDPDAPLASAEGRAPRELMSEFSAEAMAWRLPATWLDGSTTELSVELAGDLEQACNGSERMHLLTTLHVSTSDGRLDMVQPARLTRFWASAIAATSWEWLIETEVMDDATLEGVLGSVDVLLAGAEVQMTAGGDAKRGTLTVTRSDGGSLSSREYLRWCTSGDCPPQVLP